MIYHIADQGRWKNCILTGFYEHPSLGSEGFIHTCLATQIASVRQRYYEGVKDLLLLHIDEKLVTSLIKYELAPSVQEVFPHIYGPLNRSAVVKTEIL